MKKLAFVLVFIFSGCQKYGPERCEELAMKSHRGLVNFLTIYEKKCLDVPHDLTLEKCRSAFKALILTGSKAQVEKGFGPKAMGCFSERDRKNFLKN